MKLAVARRGEAKPLNLNLIKREYCVALRLVAMAIGPIYSAQL